MSSEIVPVSTRNLARRSQPADLVPAFVADAGEDPSRRFIEFFTVNIRNPNTRAAYLRAVRKFADWCDDRGFQVNRVKPVAVAA